MDRTLKLWDVETGKLVRTLEGNRAPVSALAFSPGGTLFATAGPGAGGSIEVLLWDAKTGRPRGAFSEQTEPVGSLAFSPDGTVLAIGGGAALRSADAAEPGPARTPGGFKLWKVGSPPAEKK